MSACIVHELCCEISAFEGQINSQEKLKMYHIDMSSGAR